MEENSIIYSGYWRRLSGHVLDVIFIVVFFWITDSLSGGIKSLAALIVVFQGMTYYLYTLFFHASYGQTFGKRIMGIKVVSDDGKPIGFQKSFRRNIPLFFESLPWIIGTLFALSQISNEQFHSLFLQPKLYSITLESLRPDWHNTVQIVFAALIFMELMIMFITKKRQTIHDLIGSTIVIRNSTLK